MSSVGTQKPHALLLPYPSQGHIVPLMRLAKLLHSRGFHITFVNTEFNHRRLIRSKGPESVKGLEDFRFETIPDGLSPSDQDATQDIPQLSDSVRKNCLVPFKELLSKLNTNSDMPPVSCVISDGVMSFAVKAAEEFGVPEIQFWTSSASSFVGHLHHGELVKRGIVPFPNDDNLHDGTLEKPVDWIVGMSSIRLKDLPSFIRTTDPNDIMFEFSGEQAQNCLKSPAIIFNTFDELEHEALEAIKNHFKFPKIYTIGPLPLLARNFPQSKGSSINPNLWEADPDVFAWLDKKDPNSVVLVNFGSITTMSSKNFQEFAWGLANSNQNFLWVIRPDIVKGVSTALGEEFLQEIKDKGMLTSWCAQEQVLAHASVGAFLTHCGWNSTTETICAGVPVICWPFFSDQPTNCHYCCQKWGIGMEICSDVKREEVAVLLSEMIDGEKGRRMRMMAKDWKKKAEEATDIAGSSHSNFENFIREALHFSG